VSAKPSAPLFDSTPLPFPALPGLDLRLAFKIERLKLPGLAPLSAVEGKLRTVPGGLALDDVRAGLAGGTVRGRISAARGDDAVPKVALSVDAKSLSIPTFEAGSGRGDHFRGGKADLSANLALTATRRKPRRVGDRRRAVVGYRCHSARRCEVDRPQRAPHGCSSS
jgi:hypothetical protein